MTNWQFNRTLYGDPNTHKSSEAIGYQRDHVELAEFIDQHGNTKIETVEEHSNPGTLDGTWERIDTYYGDPETGQHHEVTGRKPYHRRLARYINVYGKTKTEVLNNDEYEQSWKEQKREYQQRQAKKHQNQTETHPHKAAGMSQHHEDTIPLSALNGATLTYETSDGDTVSVAFDSNSSKDD